MLKIITNQTGSGTFQKLEGTLDILTTEKLMNEYSQIQGIEQLELNLEQLEFIDSTGIGALLEILYDSKQKGITLELSNINPTIREVLDTIGLFRVMEAIQRER